MSLIRFALTGSPTISGTMWVIDGITGRPAASKICFSRSAAICCAKRSSDDAFKCRTLASAPATTTGDSDVVKMKPGA